MAGAKAAATMAAAGTVVARAVVVRVEDVGGEFIEIPPAHVIND